jgi:hypothetical protein
VSNSTNFKSKNRSYQVMVFLDGMWNGIVRYVWDFYDLWFLKETTQQEDRHCKKCWYGQCNFWYATYNVIVTSIS